MVRGFLGFIMIVLVGCGGDVHEVVPGKSNATLQTAIGVPLVEKKKEVRVFSKESAPKKEKVLDPVIEVKEENISLKMAVALKNVQESKRLQKVKEFEDKYRLAQAQIQKDIMVAKIGSTSALELAEIEAEKQKNLKAKELAVSLETTKLESVIKKQEIEAGMEKTKIEKIIKEKELSNKIEQVKLQNELSLQKQKNDAVLSHEKMDLYKIILIVFAVLILITLFMIYFISKRNREVTIQLQEKEILKDREMQILEHQNQRVNKMLEIVSGQELSQVVESELLNSIKDANKTIWIVEDKDKKGKKKGLIFKD